MRSMTGYGRAEASLPGFDLSVEVKGVNGRYLDTVVRLPRELAGAESSIKRAAQARLRRGRVEINVSLSMHSSDQFQLNEAMVDNYSELVQQASSRGVEGRLDLRTLFQLPGVLTSRQLDPADGDVERGVVRTTITALEAMVRERVDEGRTLEEDLRARSDVLQKILSDIEEGSDGMIEHYREKLHQRIERLAAEKAMDANRIAQEVIFYAEKADISEELTRLRRHRERFLTLIDEAGGESIGKSLDFLCQEMNREMNTILSKSPKVEISDRAVEGKAEVERIREQVQNVE